MTKLGKRLKYQSEDDKPVTISLRLPRELHARLEQYATQHRQSISELVRDGLEWRLGDGDPRGQRDGSGTSNSQEYYGHTEREQETQAAEALQEVRTLLAQQWEQIQALAQALARQRVLDSDVAYSSNTENAPSVVQDVMAPRVKVDKEEVLVRIQQMRDKGLDSTQITKELQAEGVPTLSAEAQLQAVVQILEHRAVEDCSEENTRSTSPASMDTIPPVPANVLQAAQNPALARVEVLTFDPTKHHLGALCKAGHDYHGTGKSLRTNNTAGYCLACNAEQARARRQGMRQPDRSDKAALVERLQQMRAGGMNLQQIADQLTAEGQPTRSGRGRWQKGTVAKLLTSGQGQVV